MLERQEEYMLAKRWREHGDTEAGKSAGKSDDTGLVGDTDQRLFDGRHGCRAVLAA